MTLTPEDEHELDSWDAAVNSSLFEMQIPESVSDFPSFADCPRQLYRGCLLPGEFGVGMETSKIYLCCTENQESSIPSPPGESGLEMVCILGRFLSPSWKTLCVLAREGETIFMTANE